MKKVILLLALTCTFNLVFAQTPKKKAPLPVKPYEPAVIDDQEGFVICSGGGTNNALFSKNCKSLTFYRVGGGKAYEGTCTDDDGKSFFLACQAFSFEYAKKIAPKEKTYWQKSQKKQR